MSLSVFAGVGLAGAPAESDLKETDPVFGGPAEVRTPAAAQFDEAALTSLDVSGDFPIADSGDEATAFIVMESAALLSAANPASNALPGREGLLIYKVQKGDTLSKIAAAFDISLNTILWANSDLKGNYLKPGQELIILPATGVIHYVEEGETLDSIALWYNAPLYKILKANPQAQEGLRPGVKLIIPDGRPKKNPVASAGSNLPNLAGYFALPTTGWNWGKLHPVNAVDIANACGTPIYAAAEGLVAEVGDPLNWNGGNGGLVEIEHPNRVSTRYAHTEKNFVSAGDYVLKGELISEMGNTGNVIGNPGCHLHFEVRGAKNPLAK